jgi:hypothetical protein
MQSRINRTLSAFGWQQWLVLTAFLVITAFTAFTAVRTARRVIYWRAHRDEPIRGWMNVGHVAHSYRVPAAVLYLALGLPEKPPDKRPLREIAKMQHRSMEEIRAILLDAIVHARPPYSEPQSPPATQEKSP